MPYTPIFLLTLKMLTNVNQMLCDVRTSCPKKGVTVGCVISATFEIKNVMSPIKGNVHSPTVGRMSISANIY